MLNIYMKKKVYCQVRCWQYYAVDLLCCHLICCPKESEWNNEGGLSPNSWGKPQIISQEIGSWLQLGVPMGQQSQTHIKSGKGTAKSGYTRGFRMTSPKSWLDPHWEHVDCAEETSLCQEANKCSLTSPILSRRVIKNSARGLREACGRSSKAPTCGENGQAMTAA